MQNSRAWAVIIINMVISQIEVPFIVSGSTLFIEMCPKIFLFYSFPPLPAELGNYGIIYFITSHAFLDSCVSFQSPFDDFVN